MINAVFLEVFAIRTSYQYVSNIVKGILEMVFILSPDFCFGIRKFTFSYKGVIVFPIERVWHWNGTQDAIFKHIQEIEHSQIEHL